MMEEEKPKIRRMRFQVMTHIDPFSGKLRKDVFVDEKLFEWEVDEKSWKMLNKMGNEFVEVAKLDIMKHFCQSLSDFIGREIKPGNVMLALKTGWI